ncbi:hypothetical protein JEZ13_07095, partial [bacterium]|nr:hypothetical protein [bacterium]
MKRIGLTLLILLFITVSLKGLTYSVVLIDSYGDGWNGGTLTVKVNSTAELTNLTIESGGGPEIYPLEVSPGDLIETIYTAGNWPEENEYQIKNELDQVVAESGQGGQNPGNITYNVPQAGAPIMPTLNSPVDQAYDQALTTFLEWTEEANTSWCRLYYADNSGFLNATEINSATSPYQVSLDYNTTYYWKVIAVSTTNLETSSHTYSFTTEYSVIDEFPYTDGFENSWVGLPSAPLGWQQISVSGTNIWQQSSVSPHSGSYSAKAPFSATGGEHLLITPTFNFDSSITYRLKFWLKGHSTYPTDLKVQIADGNYSDETDFTTDLAYYITGNNMPTEWTEETILLSDYSGNHAIAFRAIDDDGYYVYIDDITIEEVPATALMDIQPESIDFGDFFQGDVATTETVTISNIGDEAGEITEISVSDNVNFNLSDENLYPFTINSQSSITVDVTPVTTTIGLHQANLIVSEVDPANSGNIITYNISLEANIRDNTGNDHHNPFILTYADQIIENSSTTGYSHSYDFCTSPSVVFKLTLEDAKEMEISLEGTAWDTKLWVFNSYASIDTATFTSDAWYYNDDESTAGQGGRSQNNKKMRDRATWSKMNPTLALAGDYYIVVSGFNTASGDFIMTINLTEYTIPEVVSYVSPEDGGIDVEVNSNLVWNESEYADGYLVYLSTDNTFTEVSPQDIQTTSYSYSMLEYSTDYYWKVVPYNILGQPSFGVATWSFTTMADPIISLPIIIDFEDSASISAEITASNMEISAYLHGASSNIISKNIFNNSTDAYIQFQMMNNIDDNSKIFFDYRIVDYTSPWPATSLVTGHDYLTVKASVDNGLTFTDLDQINSNNHLASTDMANYIIDIGSYAGSRAIFRFEMEWDGVGDYYFDIDNIEFREPYPMILEAETQAGSIELTWSAPLLSSRNRALLGYNVYRNSTQINSSTLNDTFYVDTDISHGEIYEYYVQAIYESQDPKTSNQVEVFALVLYLEGEGTESDPLIVADLDDLYCLSLTPLYWARGTFIEQIADIDASDTQNWNDGAGFSPIGNADNKFYGNYNGNGYVISNLYINRGDTSRIGLFGEIYNANIANIGLTNVDFIGDQNVGGLIGASSYSTISRCFSTGDVYGTYTVGGLIGSCVWYSSLENSYSQVNVTSTNYRAGGLVGNTSSPISNCYSTGVVTGNTGFGGLIGVSSSTITNCFWDTESSNQATSQGGTGLTTTQMQTLTTFTGAGWDFSSESANGQDDIWTYANNDYPRLSWEFIAPPQDLTATINIGTVTLTWTAPELRNVYNRALLGYNIYRNDIQINETTIETTSFSDSDIQNNQIYNYYVIAVFNEGESIKSNPLQINYSLLDGEGTSVSPYLIETLNDLYILSQIEDYWLSGTYLEQTADIDASATQNWDLGAGFLPIGNNISRFSGNYNGNNFSINNLYINRETLDGVGLFGSVDDVFLENIRLENVNILARSVTGALVGISVNSDFAGCSATGTISIYTQTVNNNAYTGGLIGRNSSSGQPSTISDCFTDVDIYALDTSARRIGGITGFMLSGWSDVTGYPMLIDNCYSLGSITGDQEIGGLVGVVQVHANGDLITIKDSYSISNIPDNTLNGGLIGRRIGTSQTINCFWNAETTAALSGVGDGSETGIVQKTTSEMQTYATYINAGWDFQAETVNGQEDNWTFVANDYPHLAWEGYTNELTSPPLNLQASVEDGSINLSWSPPQQEVPGSRALTGYNVYRDSIQINAETILDTLYSDTDLIHDQTYTYYVRALYDEGESEASYTIDAQAIYLFLSGQGTETNPYLINNLTDLYILSQKNIYWASGKYLEQTADIDASDTQNWDNGAGFSPIGNLSSAFKGSYNGNNFLISSLYINRPTSNYVGLFGNNRNATITNVHIEDAEIHGAERVGGLLGQAYQSTISNSYSTGQVSGESMVGGLVGLAFDLTINNS